MDRIRQPGTSQLPHQPQSPENLWVVFWQHRTSKAQGHGEPISKALASAAVIDANRTHPDIFHWMEPVTMIEAGV